MAPPKASFPARILAGDFLGLNWNRVNWMAPYQNIYPYTVTGGWGGRLFSSFVTFGRFDNRAVWINVRNFVLLTPALLLVMVMFFQPDMYQLTTIWYSALGKATPQ